MIVRWTQEPHDFSRGSTSANEIQKTCKLLGIRIKERFPNSRLNETCDSLIQLSDEIDQTNAWIKQPNLFIRIGSWLLIAITVLIIVPTYSKLNVTLANINIADFFQMLDSSFNIIVLFGGTGIYLMTTETRQKRKRVISSINKLKCIAHVIDAHQLTKDSKSSTVQSTTSSPIRTLTDYELGRYLDYCSEMLSLIGKIAFLYIQNFNDPVANDSVNDLEALTTGLSQKIWQKIVIVEKEE